MGLAAGAEGGKILGAGGGGFLMFIADKDRHEEIKHSLSELQCVDFQLESEGPTVTSL